MVYTIVIFTGGLKTIQEEAFMKRKLLCLTMAIIMSLSMAVNAFATNSEAQLSATELNRLGIFSGTGKNADGTINFDLQRSPNVQEALTTLTYTLGKHYTAIANQYSSPFANADSWAKPYIGYAYQNGVLAGIDEKTFNVKSTVSAAQYISFILNALGYEVGKDFHPDKPWELSDHIGLTDGRYNEKTKAFTRGDMAIISLSAYRLVEKLKNATYFGLPADIKWIPNSTYGTNVYNNILYSFLIGNYTLEGAGLNDVEINYAIGGRKALANNYPDLIGFFSNTNSSLAGEAGNLYIAYEQNVFTAEQLYEQQMLALKAALQIKNELHSKGKIKDGMTEKEIARVYYDYISTSGVVAGGGNNPKINGMYVEWDSAYACLVAKVADCVGRAAGFNLLMHVEGIKAQGVSGTITGNEGHVISRLILDGEEYFCDWGNRKGIHLYGLSHFTIDDDSLERARNI